MNLIIVWDLRDEYHPMPFPDFFFSGTHTHKHLAAAHPHECAQNVKVMYVTDKVDDSSSALASDSCCSTKHAPLVLKLTM